MIEGNRNIEIVLNSGSNKNEIGCITYRTNSNTDSKLKKKE